MGQNFFDRPDDNLDPWGSTRPDSPPSAQQGQEAGPVGLGHRLLQRQRSKSAGILPHGDWVESGQSSLSSRPLSTPMHMGVYDLMPRKTAALYRSEDTIVNSSFDSSSSSSLYSSGVGAEECEVEYGEEEGSVFGEDSEYMSEDESCSERSSQRGRPCRRVNGLIENGEPSEEELTLSNIFEDKAENFVMAALFCASEEGNVDGLKELAEMAANVDHNTANKRGETAV
ncbi:uncharacterized protein LOC101857599, partial [Aplysia californica]|uniref:Uncharacterized protein LOC101857599 n=1 Tax=Aplysia californica TaxID=6500 RepID=A0ABM1W0T3_APLCA